jgi:hypothetical protein
MADPTRHRGTGADPDSAAGTPRWVKVFGLVVLALLALFVVLHLAGLGGGHGPGRHGGGGRTPPAEHRP